MHFEPIGYIRSPFKDKFGIPRQPQLVTSFHSEVELLPPFARAEAFKALDGFSHVWILFVFHQDCLDASWKPTVRPPRLGGKTSVGVFASRAPYRPNPIGMSALRHHGLREQGGKLFLQLEGGDMLDGTPVLDIKPYIPYADMIPDALAGYTSQPKAKNTKVCWTNDAEVALQQLAAERFAELKTLIEALISEDPRPGYMQKYPDRQQFGLRLENLDVKWQQLNGYVLITIIQPYLESKLHG